MPNRYMGSGHSVASTPDAAGAEAEEEQDGETTDADPAEAEETADPQLLAAAVGGGGGGAMISCGWIVGVMSSSSPAPPSCMSSPPFCGCCCGSSSCSGGGGAGGSCSGKWVTGSIPIRRSFLRMCVFQWFLISLSVLPGSCAAILDHLRHVIR
jgi:hypothetical protein